MGNNVWAMDQREAAQSPGKHPVFEFPQHTSQVSGPSSLCIGNLICSHTGKREASQNQPEASICWRRLAHTRSIRLQCMHAPYEHIECVQYWEARKDACICFFWGPGDSLGTAQYHLYRPLAQSSGFHPGGACCPGLRKTLLPAGHAVVVRKT